MKSSDKHILPFRAKGFGKRASVTSARDSFWMPAAMNEALALEAAHKQLASIESEVSIDNIILHERKRKSDSALPRAQDEGARSRHLPSHQRCTRCKRQVPLDQFKQKLNGNFRSRCNKCSGDIARSIDTRSNTEEQPSESTVSYQPPLPIREEESSSSTIMYPSSPVPTNTRKRTHSQVNAHIHTNKENAFAHKTASQLSPMQAAPATIQVAATRLAKSMANTPEVHPSTHKTTPPMPAASPAPAAAQAVAARPSKSEAVAHTTAHRTALPAPSASSAPVALASVQVAGARLAKSVSNIPAKHSLTHKTTPPITSASSAHALTSTPVAPLLAARLAKPIANMSHVHTSTRNPLQQSSRAAPAPSKILAAAQTASRLPEPMANARQVHTPAHKTAHPSSAQALTSSHEPPQIVARRAEPVASAPRDTPANKPLPQFARAAPALTRIQVAAREVAAHIASHLSESVANTPATHTVTHITTSPTPMPSTSCPAPALTSFEVAAQTGARLAEAVAQLNNMAARLEKRARIDSHTHTHTPSTPPQASAIPRPASPISHNLDILAIEARLKPQANTTPGAHSHTAQVPSHAHVDAAEATPLQAAPVAARDSIFYNHSNSTGKPSLALKSCKLGAQTAARLA